MAKIELITIIQNITKFLPKYLHEKLNETRSWNDFIDIMETNEFQINNYIKKGEITRIEILTYHPMIKNLSLKI